MPITDRVVGLDRPRSARDSVGGGRKTRVVASVRALRVTAACGAALAGAIASARAAAVGPPSGGWDITGTAGGFTVDAAGSAITAFGLGGGACAFAFDLPAPIPIHADGS